MWGEQQEVTRHRGETNIKILLETKKQQTRRMTFMDELIPRLHGRKGAVKGDCMDALMSELQEPFPTVHPVHPVHKKPGNARFIQIASITILIYDPSEVVFSASTSLAGLSISSTIAMGALSPVL